VVLAAVVLHHQVQEQVGRQPLHQFKVLLVVLVKAQITTLAVVAVVLARLEKMEQMPYGLMEELARILFLRGLLLPIQESVDIMLAAEQVALVSSALLTAQAMVKVDSVAVETEVHIRTALQQPLELPIQVQVAAVQKKAVLSQIQPLVVMAVQVLLLFVTQWYKGEIKCHIGQK